jgi:predicted nucleic acid-binding protein
LIQKLGSPQFQPIISPPLCFEYEDVLLRPRLIPNLKKQEVGDFLDYLISVCVECPIHFLWRPYLPDPKDDLVLELALAGNAPWIITHNTRHFRMIHSLGIRAVTPDEFMRTLSTP